MTLAESAAFSSQVERDPALAARVAESRLLITGIREVSILKAMNEFHAGLGQEATPVIQMDRSKGNASMKRWLVAASIALVVGLASWFLLRPAGGDRLYEAYYEKDPGLISAMGTSDNYQFDKAMIDYKNGKYQDAIKAWEQLSVSHPLSDTLNYFLGSAFLAVKDPAKAIVSFNKLLPQKNSVFYADANWYLGLALIGQGKKQEAIPYLRRSGRANREELIGKLQ